ncbi:nucleotidyltransferase family protein [Rhizobium hainanense]|uniref:Nucleotidyltransferase n=1 Tax=Rhizobium hainanense TaxID=52131 RepID=A0A1C3TVW8_9HYPH|nr:nucleotidyltransferase family protein [Rhizobium hainanense]SCB07371.1 hypothetical protein GA0061100_101141 [Rhizobium hainanense]
MPITTSDFVAHVLENEINRELLVRLPPLKLPQCVLTAGCLFQTLWNYRSGRSPNWGVKDYDIFYFDDRDLSWEAEDDVIQTVKQALGSLSDRMEIRNQARVHLWYPEKFGKPYPPLKRVEEGIDRYLISCTRVGIRVDDGSVYAPDGFDDMWNGVLRVNPANVQPDLFKRKCVDFLARWPWLSISD